MSPEGTVKDVGGDGGGSILADRQGQIWIGGSGTNSGLRLFTISGDGATAQLKRVYRKADGLPLERAMAAIYETSEGRILISIGDNLCEFLPAAPENESKFRVVVRGNFQSLAEDGGGNLWLGTIQEGSLKLIPNGFVVFDGNDGIPPQDITSLFISPTDDLFIMSGENTISRYTNGKFESVVPAGAKSRSWGINQLDFQSMNGGDWWIPTGTGLRVYHQPANFKDLAVSQANKIFTTANGLFSDNIFNIFEDSRGDVWIATTGSADSLHRWERKTGDIHRYTTADGLPNSNGATNFGEDADGNVWLGFYFGGLARYKDGKFQFFTAADGIPVGSVNSIYTDKTGRLWIASASRGVFRTDDPTSDHPHFINLSTADGLSSNRTNCVVEDDLGQIYIGTGRGINRINASSASVKVYTQADGLPGSVVLLCRREQNGSLWFVLRNSLVKFVPQSEKPRESPPIYIGGISISGTERKISERGEESINELDLSSDQRQIKIDFFALGFAAGERLRYQYKLGDHNWSERKYRDR